MSQYNTKWKFNGAEVEFDIADIETAERYEKAFEEAKAEAEKLPKVGSNADIMRATCELYRSVFAKLFGEETMLSLMGEKLNASVCYDCYESFIRFVGAQSTAMRNQRNRIGEIGSRAGKKGKKHNPNNLHTV